MAVSFKLKPRKGDKRQAPELQGEAVQEMGQTPSAQPDSNAGTPQWFDRPLSTLEKQLEILPDPPTESEYDEFPIDMFAKTILARISAGGPHEGRKKARTEVHEREH